jgi:Glutathione S-transferase, N-terminal domain
MRLYVCWGTWRPAPRPGGHPCGQAYHALRQAGHDPRVFKSYGLGLLPGIFNRTRGRREVQELTGDRWVPTLVLDDGTVVDGSREIIDWARVNPASQPSASPASGTAADRT